MIDEEALRLWLPLGTRIAIAAEMLPVVTFAPAAAIQPGEGGRDLL